MVLTIRDYVTMLRTTRHQRTIAQIASQEAEVSMNNTREIVINQFVTNLWRRYRSITKGLEVTPSFGEWLDGKKIEDTYRQGIEGGHRLETLQQWASRVIKEVRRPENNPLDWDGDDIWFIEVVGRRLSTKQLDLPSIYMYPAETKSKKYPSSPTFIFFVTRDFEEEEPEEEEEEEPEEEPDY